MAITPALAILFAVSAAFANPDPNGTPAGKLGTTASGGLTAGASDVKKDEQTSGETIPDPTPEEINDFTVLPTIPVLIARWQNATPDKRPAIQRELSESLGSLQVDRNIRKWQETWVATQNHVKEKRETGGSGGDEPWWLKDESGGQFIGRVSDVLPQQYIAKHPDNPWGYQQMGGNYLDRKDYENSYNHYDKAIQLGARDPNTLAGYASSALNLGDSQLAASASGLALQQDPGHRLAFAVHKLSEGRTSKVALNSSLTGEAGVDRMAAGGAASAANAQLSGAAAAQLSQQSAGSPPPPTTAAEVAAAIQRQMNAEVPASQKSAALTKEAATYLRVDDYSGAYAMATKAIELNERNAQAYTYRAMANNGLGRFGEAVNDASTALTLVPGNAVSLQTRSASFLGMGRYQDALADANHTLEKQQNGQAYYNRAFALAGMGDRSEVLESLRAAAQVDPKFQPIYQNALQMPDEADMLLLFKPNQVSVVNTAKPLTPEARRKRFVRLMALTASGGLLVALGLLHVLAPSWRDKVRNTVRRVIGAAPEAVATQGTPMPTSGFWSGYTVSREIGIGGMGVVYEATDNSLSRRVAIKKMRDEIRLDPQERRRFVAEARTVASLHHPHIVDIYAIVEDDSDVYLVFEFIDGKTLSELVKEGGPMSFEGAREVMKGVCGAVDFAHRNGVIHRDIKPSNIMVSQEGGHVKVMDFGVARQAKEAITKMAQTNTIVGTPPYMAPEQEQGSVRRESDVFALGVCYYELITGKLPFSGQGAGMLLNKINGRHIPASQVRQGLPAGLDDVLAKALCPDPDKRYKTASEFLAALEGVSAVKTA